MEGQNKNYLLQSNFFNQTILHNISEIQRDILYYLQKEINFREDNPSGEIFFDYNKFLSYKKTSKNDTYDPQTIIDFAKKMIKMEGIIYNIQTNNIEIFNIIDKVSVGLNDPENFTIKLASWGRIFFYEKFAREYAQASHIQYTQLENAIIDLKGSKRRKLYELLSQFRETGLYITSIDELRSNLGFSIYDYEATDEIPENIRVEKQLKLHFEGKTPTKEIFKTWRSLKQSFLDPAVEEFNSRRDLDIKDLSYDTTKKGQKIVGLIFKFSKRNVKESLTSEEKVTLDFFLKLGLNEKQIIFLINKIGSVEMMERSAKFMEFNKSINDKDSPNYNRSVWFEIKTGDEIKNTGGFLYDKVFLELKN